MLPSPLETRASLILRLPDAADVVAWDEAVAIYAPLIRRLAVAQGMQPADADDLVQEVFSAIARSVSDWLERPDRGGFRTWLLAIARNAALNLLTRRGTRSLAAGGDDAAGMLADVESPAADISGQFDLEYRREVFRWAAAQVRDQVAEATWSAFWMTHVEGETVADVAKRLRVTVGTVYVSRSRVMNRLQEVVKQYEVTK
ncbi:ECF RNA polymerase sigma factor SigE [Roseimaritima multifibrata]|uniref:ECF RNA polymerase sigma factor SigE n=1 Tax=Roseimaritima multifibrata TaxID=1930274 RepID=A0A517MMS6_9BACT|nr:sigma-70 family RNA polymerase sigma factor [Roseimaritima multifibrata]QDS96195.1 ECF RNA polymerase sigma factor SigE [Roseimaritima multifibrata]